MLASTSPLSTTSVFYQIENMSTPSNNRKTSSSSSIKVNTKVTRSNSILRPSSTSSFLHPTSPSSPIRRCSFSPPLPTEKSQADSKPLEPTSLIERRRRGSAGASEIPIMMTFNDLPPSISTGEEDLAELVSPEIIGNSAEIDLVRNTPGGTLEKGPLLKHYFSSSKRRPTPYPQEERTEWLEVDEEQGSEQEEDEHDSKRTSIHSVLQTKED